MNLSQPQSVLIVILLLIIVVLVIKHLFSKDYAKLFSPIVFLCGYYVFYIVMPFFSHLSGYYEWIAVPDASKLIFATILSLLSFLIGWAVLGEESGFARTIRAYEKSDALPLGIVLFLIAALAHFFINGVNLNVVSEQSYSGSFNEEGSYRHSEMYISYLVALFPAVCTIFLANRKYIIGLFALTVAILAALMEGFRFRLTIIFLCVFVSLHLYPRVRKVLWGLWIPLALLFYISMGVVERSRHYGHGLDVERIEDIQWGMTDTKSIENEVVYEFSADVMSKYTMEDYIWFEPLSTAIFMPIPRSLFPWKPNGYYMREANLRSFGTIEHGGAFLNIVEGYISFGWLGVIIYGFVLGLLSRLFWNTYNHNRKSLAAVLLLGLYDGTLFVIVSRGYLAQSFTYFVYYILIFCWISQLLSSISIFKKSRR